MRVNVNRQTRVRTFIALVLSVMNLEHMLDHCVAQLDGFCVSASITFFSIST